MTLIGLISDVHAAPAPLEEALSIFAEAGVSQVFCGGDIAGYNEQLEQTITLLESNNVQSIIGNHDLKYLKQHDGETENHAVSYLKKLPEFIETVIDGKRLYFVHAQPPLASHGGIKLMDKLGNVQGDKLSEWAETLKTFDYDVLVVGHTHQVFSEMMGDMLVVNPGSSVFNHSCAILSLPDLKVEMIALSDKEITRTWNWGDHVIYAGKG